MVILLYRLFLSLPLFERGFSSTISFQFKACGHSIAVEIGVIMQFCVHDFTAALDKRKSSCCVGKSPDLSKLCTFHTYVSEDNTWKECRVIQAARIFSLFLGEKKNLNIKKKKKRNNCSYYWSLTALYPSYFQSRWIYQCPVLPDDNYSGLLIDGWYGPTSLSPWALCMIGLGLPLTGSFSISQSRCNTV